jgi:hypothetical protein
VVVDDELYSFFSFPIFSDVSEKMEGEHVKHGDKDKHEVHDVLSNRDDASGSRNGDMQNSEFAGGLELLVHEMPENCIEEDIAVDMQNSEFAGGLELLFHEMPENCIEEDIAAIFSECGEIKTIRIIRNSSTLQMRTMRWG